MMAMGINGIYCTHITEFCTTKLLRSRGGALCV
jgi:hypothetical protein